MMPDATARPTARRTSKYHRARVRRFIFTIGPNRISGGRIRRRLLAQDIVLREVEITSPIWPADFDGLRIGHISDFHLGELMPMDRAIEAVDRLGAQEPDLVVCTGDLVDLDHHHCGPVLDALAAIHAPLGAIMVLGNHDELHHPEAIVERAAEAGVMILRNEVAQINYNGNQLAVAGIHWAKSAVGCAEHVEATCGDYVDLLLAHNPKAFVHAADMGIPLTLAGHTHGGQIAIKGRPNANLALSHRHRVGLFESGPSRLYVTAGVGAWFPLRINCPAEFAILTVRSDPTG